MVTQKEIDGLVGDLTEFQIDNDPTTYNSGITAIRCALVLLHDYRNTGFSRKTLISARERLDDLFAQARGKKLAQCA